MKFTIYGSIRHPFEFEVEAASVEEAVEKVFASDRDMLFSLSSLYGEDEVFIEGAADRDSDYYYTVNEDTGKVERAI